MPIIDREFDKVNEWMNESCLLWTIQNSRLNTKCKSIAVAVHFSLAISWFEVFLALTSRQQKNSTELWTMIIPAALFPFSTFLVFPVCRKHEGERLFSEGTEQMQVLQTRMETMDRTRLVSLWPGRKLAGELALSCAGKDNIMANGCAGMEKISAGLEPPLAICWCQSLMQQTQTEGNTLAGKPGWRKRLLFKSETLDAPSVGVSHGTLQGF